MGDGVSDSVIGTDKVLLPFSENSCDSTGKGGSMQLTHLSIHTCTLPRYQHNLASCLSWRKVTSSTEESSTTVRRRFLPLQRAALSDAARSHMMVLEIPISTAAMSMVAETA